MATVKEASKLLETVYESARGFIVPCLMGSPGIGKSQAVYELAERKGADVVELIASQILPNEVSGITMPVDKTHSMEIYDHAKLSSLKDGDILFFDELLQAPSQTLAACLTLLQERKLLSGKRLPDIMIVAACNPLNSAEQVPLSIRQRFMFVDVRYNEYEWVDYMEAKGYGRNLASEISRLIEFGRKGDYNVLTPRSAEKIISWYMRCDADETRDVVGKYIEKAFGIKASDVIVRHCGKERLMQEQSKAAAKIIEIACEKHEGGSIKESLEDEAAKGLANLIGYIMTLPEWDEVREDLEKIDMDNIEQLI